MKSSATGGIDPWDTSRYLNIWIVADGGSFLGWGEFPGAPANDDGVVIRHPYFGNTGTVTSTSYGGGRTATHESVTGSISFISGVMAAAVLTTASSTHQSKAGRISGVPPIPVRPAATAATCS